MIQNIKMIELEINKHCNRTCPWCPNSQIDRSGLERFPESLLIQLLDELQFHHFGQNWYGGFISFSRNNEPFADLDYLDQVITLIKTYLPYTNLVSNTNGDFLDGALASRIDELSIMDYDCKGYEYWRSFLESEGFKFQFKLGNMMYMSGRNKKVVVCLNWPEETLMEDRGAFFKRPISGLKWRSPELRKVGCSDPGNFVAIDYDGSIMPCCCVRSDYHRHCILGNLHADTLEYILSTEKAKSFRLAAANPDILPDVCRHCHKGIGRYTRNNPGIQYSERYVIGGDE
jgi:radical SAM protein with 4Fe4S-binding SPASM domain